MSVCPECGEAFKGAYLLEYHQKRVHLDSEISVTSRITNELEDLLESGRTFSDKEIAERTGWSIAKARDFIASRSDTYHQEGRREFRRLAYKELAVGLVALAISSATFVLAFLLGGWFFYGIGILGLLYFLKSLFHFIDSRQTDTTGWRGRVRRAERDLGME